MLYQGSCHCGRVAFEFEGEIASAVSCNCSICSRQGALLWFTSRDKMRLLTPEDAAGTYLFNKHVIRHRFCPACGIPLYGEGTNQKGEATVAINLRSVQGIDLDAIPVHRYDGRSA